MKWAAGLLVPSIAAAIGWQWVPLGLWIDMNQGLLAFLGLIAAALIQVIPVTANFLQSDELTPDEAARLSRGLRRQQHYWLGLLASVIVAFVLVVIASVLKDRTTLTFHSGKKVDIAPFASLLLSASVTFVVVKFAGLFGGILSLHRLREELVLNAAKRRAAEKVEAAQKSLPFPTKITPDDYGTIIHPPQYWLT